jgi:hypothetical protein
MGKRLLLKLVLSIVSLTLVVITLGTSTFAWFSLSDTSEVSDINFTVGGGETIEISLNNKDFYSVIPASLIESYIKGQNNEQEICLSPVTSLDGRNVQDLSGNVLKTVEDGVNVKFIKLKIYFRATDVEDHKAEEYGLGVYLSDFNREVTYDDVDIAKGTYIVSKGVKARAGVDYTDYNIENGTQVDINSSDVVTKYASDAVRIAFYDNQYSFYGNQRDATKCYDLSYRNGMSLASYGYGYGYSEDLDQLKGSASFYYEKTNENLIPNELDMNVLNSETGFTTFGAEDRAMYPRGEEGFICYMTPVDIGTYEGYITMLVWLEGYDADCYNVIANDKIVISLNFRLAYKKVFDDEDI